MSPDDDSRICGVCGRVLEQWRPTPGQNFYRHAMIDQPADHPPVAVRSTDVPGQARYRCDICLGEPITHTLVVDRELTMPLANMVWDTEWALCQPCSELVLADDWQGMRRRAFTLHERRHGPMHEEVKAAMRIVYRDLRRHLVMVYIEDPNR